MAYINDLFRIIITERTNAGLSDWANGYKAFTSDVELLKSRIQEDLTVEINNDVLYHEIGTFNNYASFIKMLLYDRYNGVSSRGESVLSKDNLTRIIEDSDIHESIKAIIVDPNSDNYSRFGVWWKEFVGRNNPVLINRAYAASSPKTLASIVDNSKFWHVVNFLKAECELEFPDTGSNWLEWNIMITNWLDTQLVDELAAFEDELMQNIWRNIFFWMLFEYNLSSFEFKKQLVKYGAPGTGKTYTCIKEIKNHFAIWKALYYNHYEGDVSSNLSTVQFHPAYTYEDFMEGIRPIVKDGRTELKLLNGIFKKVCKKAAEWEIDIYKQLPELKEKNWNKITVSQVKDSLTGDRWNYLGDIRDPENMPLDKVIPPYYIIIDEINRAELSRVLGELMYCLEYRGYSGKIKTQYSSMVNNNDETEFWFENGENYFFIPHNVYIMGTMNNIDRSVESFDFALRRRFQWIEVEPDYNLIINDDLPDSLVPIVGSLKKLNDKISKDPLLGKDYRIGHSYFMNRPVFLDKLNLKECKHHLWDHNIKPLLEEYLRGSGENLRLKEFETIFKEN